MANSFNLGISSVQSIHLINVLVLFFHNICSISVLVVFGHQFIQEFDDGGGSLDTDAVSLRSNRRLKICSTFKIFK